MDFGKFKKSKMGSNEKEAKLSALMGLKEEMQKLMGDDVKGLKKVTVASDSPDGLEKGLEKAKEMLGSEEVALGSEKEEESSEMEEPEMDESLPDSAEECDEMIKKLEMKKMMLQKE